ncbi:MAG: diguanylate cyclase [Acidobacteriota bacterium]
MDLETLLRRRRPAAGFRRGPVDRRRLDRVLDAGRYLPTHGPALCRAVAIEDPELRRCVTESLLARETAPETRSALAEAPVLIALCEVGGGPAGRGAAWMAAAQMALAADDAGLAALAVGPPEGDGTLRALAGLGEGGRVEALVALGLPAADRGGGLRGRPSQEPVEAYLAASPPPPPPESAGDVRRFLRAYMEIASACAGAEDLDGVLERIARSLGRLFPVDGAALGLREEGAIVVREILRRGGAVRRDPVHLAAEESHLMGRVILGGRPLWRNDISTELRFSESLRGSGLRSDMTIPLRARGEIMGAFRVASRRRHAYDPEDFQVLQHCADLTAVAVETQRLLLRTRRLSQVDGLTGVHNHRHFLDLLVQEVDRARRTDRTVSLLMLDIDDFKRFNDAHGHPVGDEVLRHVADLVARLLRRSDTVARYGGEEFAVILPEAGPDEALAIGETLRSEVEGRDLRLPGLKRPLRVRVSVGAATLPGDASSPSALVEAADRGLYRAKRRGKNQVCRAP